MRKNLNTIILFLSLCMLVPSHALSKEMVGLIVDIGSKSTNLETSVSSSALALLSKCRPQHAYEEINSATKEELESINIEKGLIESIKVHFSEQKKYQIEVLDANPKIDKSNQIEEYRKLLIQRGYRFLMLVTPGRISENDFPCRTFKDSSSITTNYGIIKRSIGKDITYDEALIAFYMATKMQIIRPDPYGQIVTEEVSCITGIKNFQSLTDVEKQLISNYIYRLDLSERQKKVWEKLIASLTVDGFNKVLALVKSDLQTLGLNNNSNLNIGNSNAKNINVEDQEYVDGIVKLMSNIEYSRGNLDYISKVPGFMKIAAKVVSCAGYKLIKYTSIYEGFDDVDEF